uniref:Coiled-coil domain-containing protein 185 n=1 Tax=Pyxicephalus adspersus TaxID=30357 RepID=A0AAV3APT4_PYXAD|nr:TPA: hypothetical protein GDO54_011451 [Pyxicephalus adspersus]
MEDGRESPSLHLDLSNFEDGEGSRYVLTSPRSLEACARLGVRPVELLHKSMEEVREGNPGASGHQLNDLYVTQEIQRRRKLEMCRELRMELLQEDHQPDRTCSHSSRGHKDSPITADQHNPPTPFTDRWDPQGMGITGGSVTLQKSFSQGDLFQMEDKARRMARKVEREVWASVPDRDKKIGALMLLKHQEEETAKQRKFQAQQAWDNLKTEEQHIRAALDRQDWPIQLQNYRRRSWCSQLDWQVDPIHTSSHKAEQKTLLKYGLTKAMEDLKNKNTFHDSSSSQSLEERMIKAFKAKLIKELQDKKNVQMKNEYEKLRHSNLKEKVDNQAKAEERVKRVSIQQKEQRSQELQEKLVEQRNKGLHEKASREDELKLMAKLRAMRLEKEQMEHKKMLARLTDHKIQQATDTLEKSILSKAGRARELNFMKESVHQALKKKVDQEKEDQRREIAHVIRMKDQKSNKIRKEKEATVEEGRRIARASFHFREKIRQQTQSRTFDQMALQATLNASLLKTIP